MQQLDFFLLFIIHYERVLLANVFIPAVINELTLFLQQKMMIKNHINALRVRILFKGKSIKT